MKFGFNSKVQVGPDVYDVQTEDRGASHPFIDTLVLIRGRVAYRHSTSYEDLAASGAMDQAILRARVEKQHREILDALRAGALSLEKSALEKAAPSKGAGIAVKLLNARSWLHSGHVTLDIEVSSKGGGQPVTGAKVEAFVEGGEGAPESYFAHTDAEGRTSLHFPFPTLVEPSIGALVIRAQVAEALGELRYQLKPRRPSR
ncbi:MAG TPA: hypothetical protein VEL77_10110 [Rugosimonospora sp.]|nr:hypothetical protein [Rugosimonospora sp.]